MPKLNYYSKMKAENKTLRLICSKYTNLDKEPLFLKYLSGKVVKPEQVVENLENKDKFIVEFN
tara:strand:+ start:306 stop:494 length:189 start_codon:yes stop_codon:yes gene_type:complete